MNKQNLLLTVLFASILLWYSCGSNAQNAFPDVVEVSMPDSLKRIKGTKLFVKAPGNYEAFEKLLRLQKNDRTYLQVMEVPGNDFNDYKSKTTPESIKSQGARIDIYELVNYNGFDGIYIEGPSKIDGETKISLAFGDNSFTTIIVGVCRTADKSSKEELKNIFSSSYYDKSYALSPFELADYQIDESITGFKYAGKFGNTLVYTPKGESAPTDSMMNIAYFIMTLNAGSFETIKDFMETMNSRFQTKWTKYTNVKKKEIMINGNKAFEIIMEAVSKEGERGHFYEVGIFKESSSSGLVFMGTDDEKKAWFEKYIATAQSIRL